MLKKTSAAFLAVLFLFSSVYSQSQNKPKNIIFLIGDGMGIGQVSLSIYNDTVNNPFKKFKTIGFSVTASASDLITDSGAGATAFAIGEKSHNHAISVDKNDVAKESIFERLKKKGYSTGVVATSSLTDATPACFVTHVPERSHEFEIAKQFSESTVDIAIGGGLTFFADSAHDGERAKGDNLLTTIQNNGYDVFTDYEDLAASDMSKKTFAILDYKGLPKAPQRDYALGDLTEKALQYLSKDKDGFMLMVEGSQIDWGGHAKDNDYVAGEMTDFLTAINKALEFAEKDGNTLVVVTADHETGGAAITEGKRGSAKLNFIWGSHTANMVGIFAYGPGAELFSGIIENNQIGQNFIELTK